MSEDGQSNPWLLAMVVIGGTIALWYLAPEIFGRKRKA